MAPNLNSDDYYELLGVPRGCDDAALKKAYKKLALKFHPDRNPGDEQATKSFQKISEAFSTLSDPKKRQIYDQYGKEAANQSDQMPDGMPGGAGGMPFGFRPGGGGGGMHHGGGMSPDEAQQFFSHIFGGSDPFGSFGGGGMGGMGGPGVRFSSGHPGMRRGGSARMQADPFAQMFGSSMGGGMPAGFGGSMGGGMPGGFGGSMGGGMPGSGSFRQQPQPKRYDAIPPGTVVSLKGLVSRPEKNGDRGEIQQYDPNSGRYIVHLEDTDETMSVKASNLLQHVHVKLHGLESKPEWNGQRGTIIAWDENNQRYNVYVMGLQRAVSLKPTNVVLEDGTVAKITGLQSKPELNGKFGTIKKFDQASGRYDVQFSAEKILRLKLENIHV